MLANRRSSERRTYQGMAKIQFGVGSLPRDCTVVDISDGGMRLVAEYLDIPNEFIVLLPDARRQCRLAWRIGCEFGAEFIDRNRTP